jgi:hypothetical protein
MEEEFCAVRDEPLVAVMKQWLVKTEDFVCAVVTEIFAICNLMSLRSYF